MRTKTLRRLESDGPSIDCTHLVCHTCATARHGTDIDPRDAPHEVVTDSENEAGLFRLAHHAHDTSEAAL